MAKTITDDGIITGYITNDSAVLTGSRRFLKRTDSDWDFVADYHNKNWQPWFKANGYTKIFIDSSYSTVCSDTKEIWQKQYGPSESEKVQVVMSSNFKGKKRIIEWLEKRPDLMKKYYQVPKNERHKVWQFLQNKAEAGDI